MEDRFEVTFDAVIRTCRREDLSDLEWFGMFRDSREVADQAFARQERGEVVMLVAEANGFPIGQVWIELVGKADRFTGYMWALRVMPGFQNAGIGTRLVRAAESVMRSHGQTRAEIAVDKENAGARRLYERLGYHVVDDDYHEWRYTAPDGQERRESANVWRLQKAFD